jgi:hypothetical protein
MTPVRILATRPTARGARAATLVAASLAALAVLATGCRDFLTGPGLTENPNAATRASAAQLLVAAEIALFNQQNGQLARFAALFTQQLSGTNNQQQDYGRYTITEQDVNTFWVQNFIGGALLDYRKIQQQARAVGDQRLLGIALTLEALRIGTAASVWGDIPYRQAADSTVAAPPLDPQQQVYADLQLKLDTAITALRAAPATDPALPQDVIYNGNTARWAKAAFTLKARFHLHTAERLGAPAYEAARAAAAQGIDEAPATPAQAINGQAPGDLRSVHGQTINVDANQWAQFLGARTDMTANQQFVALLQARNDPRLPVYFAPASGGGFRGADQFGRNGAGASVVAPAPRLAYDFRQPIVTWTENQLILAEALLQTGDAAGALARVNAVRRSVGQADLPGPVTLAQMAEEKYVALFQNIEVWNDYKRLCYPALTPSGANFTPAAEVPGRLPYAFAERNANPNIPAPGAQPARNWNDPAACPRP